MIIPAGLLVGAVFVMALAGLILLLDAALRGADELIHDLGDRIRKWRDSR